MNYRQDIRLRRSLRVIGSAIADLENPLPHDTTDRRTYGSLGSVNKQAVSTHIRANAGHACTISRRVVLKIISRAKTRINFNLEIGFFDETLR